MTSAMSARRFESRNEYNLNIISNRGGRKLIGSVRLTEKGDKSLTEPREANTKTYRFFLRSGLGFRIAEKQFLCRFPAVNARKYSKKGVYIYLSLFLILS